MQQVITLLHKIIKKENIQIYMHKLTKDPSSSSSSTSPIPAWNQSKPVWHKTAIRQWGRSLFLMLRLLLIWTPVSFTRHVGHFLLVGALSRLGEEGSTLSLCFLVWFAQNAILPNIKKLLLDQFPALWADLCEIVVGQGQVPQIRQGADLLWHWSIETVAGQV